MPRGGRRPGAGRKPKAAVLRALDGGASHRPARAMPAAAPIAVIDEFAVPDDLAVDERNCWLRLAPHAFKKRTLIRATEEAFKLLCRNVVLERRYAASMQDAGGANHRGLIQRVQSDLQAFDLRPVGKPIYEEDETSKEQPAQKRAYW